MAESRVIRWGGGIVGRVLALGAAIAVNGCGAEDSGTSKPPTNHPCGTETGTGCAPDSQRVDLYEPTFSHPTTVTNPLFPISKLDSVVFLGHVDGKPFRTETTLLPETRILDWQGKKVETLVSQYMAFLDGRIEEIALDWYAQDDRGGVWYFGEDVADFEDGVIYTHEGTWLEGKDGPLAMIMPADPQVGDAYNAETIPGVAWEEVTVKEVGVTLDGPAGPIQGCMIGSELHADGAREEKIFAPGHGEFSTSDKADLEALALALPADALSGSPPAELDTLAKGTVIIFDVVDAVDWTAAGDALTSAKNAWASFGAGELPPLLADQMKVAVAALGAAVDGHDAGAARHQAIAVARLTFDFRLRHRPVTEIDSVRFDLWAAQVLVDGAADDAGGIKGDTATLELVWNRIAQTFDAAKAAEIEGKLGDLRTAADAEDVGQAVTIATAVRAALAGSGWK